MKQFLALGMTILLVACEPAYVKMLSHTGNVKECADRGFRYSLLVKYKDANIQKQDVIEVIAPRLGLPEGWEAHIESVVSEIYKEDLQEKEVFDRVYMRCIAGYGA